MPNTVKDPDAYKRYLKLSKSPTLQRENRLIYTSDPNVVIDPVGHIRFVEKKIAHLPSDEQDKIIQRTRGLKVIFLRIGSLRQKAFGIPRPSHHASLTMGILDERSSELIEYFGKMLSEKEVHKIVTTEWGYDVSIGTLKHFRLKYKQEIEKIKEQFQKDFTDIRLSHKKGRLEELVEIYQKRKQKWELSDSQQNEKLLLSTIRMIRDEVEDKSIKIDHNINAKLELTVNNHIEQEIMKSLTINDIIIARVAARMNVNPRFLITKLHNSYYAKHSGFARPDNTEQTVQYPSSIVYNWNQIGEIHKDKQDPDEQLKNFSEDPASDKAKTIKQILQQKIKAKNQDISQSEQRVNDNTKK